MNGEKIWRSGTPSGSSDSANGLSTLSSSLGSGVSGLYTGELERMGGGECVRTKSVGEDEG